MCIPLPLRKVQLGLKPEYKGNSMVGRCSADWFSDRSWAGIFIRWGGVMTASPRAHCAWLYAQLGVLAHPPLHMILLFPPALVFCIESFVFLVFWGGFLLFFFAHNMLKMADLLTTDNIGR